MPDKLPSEMLTLALQGLPGWRAGTDLLARDFQFANHIEAMGFVTRVALIAEVMDHHPDMRIVYNRVELRLSSHDAGGVTERDLKLAEKVNALQGVSA